MPSATHHWRNASRATISVAVVITMGGCTGQATPGVEKPTLGAGIGSGVTTPPSAPSMPNATTAPPSSTAALLAQLAIKGRAPKTGYDRALFGETWTDAVDVQFGRNGCDTRNDILRRDLVDLAFKAGSNGCSVQTGTLHDPYTSKTIAFTRGQSTSSAVQIDHVVALSDAWQKGAQQLDAQTRTNLANDPRNLRAVDGPTNQKKADSDAASWLPPDKTYRCQYVTAQVEVKAAYGLWITQVEHDAIADVLESCDHP